MTQIHFLPAAHGLSAFLLGATLTGCGNNASPETANTQSSPSNVHANGGSERPTTAKPAGNHDAEIRAAIGHRTLNHCRRRHAPRHRARPESLRQHGGEHRQQSQQSQRKTAPGLHEGLKTSRRI